MEPFDLRTHIVDPKTQRIIKHQPYRMIARKDMPNVFERSGQFFYENGETVSPEHIPPQYKKGSQGGK